MKVRRRRVVENGEKLLFSSFSKRCLRKASQTIIPFWWPLYLENKIDHEKWGWYVERKTWQPQNSNMNYFFWIEWIVVSYGWRIVGAITWKTNNNAFEIECDWKVGCFYLFFSVILLFESCNIHFSLIRSRWYHFQSEREKERKPLIFAYNISICSIEYIIWCSSVPFSIIHDIVFACIGSVVAVIVVFVITIFLLPSSQRVVYSKERLLFRLFLPFASCTYKLTSRGAYGSVSVVYIFRCLHTTL